MCWFVITHQLDSPGTHSNEITIKFPKLCFKKIYLKMSAILFRPQCVSSAFMGHTGNMIIKDFIREMCVPIENSVYFGDGDGVNSNSDSSYIFVFLANDLCCYNPTMNKSYLNSSPPGQNGCHFADNILKCIFMNEKFCNLIRFFLGLFLRVQMTISQHWFR